MLPVLLPELRLEGPTAVVPLLNIVLLARDLLSTNSSTGPLWGPAVVVVISTALYSVAAIAVAARLFGAEAVLYNEQSGWSDVFRRPRESQSTANPSTALLCVALLFPLSFALNGLIAQLGWPLTERMVLRALTTVALFAGLPLFAAYRGHVALSTGMQLRLPAGRWPPALVLAFLAALFLGVSLWPFDYELTLVVRGLGLNTLLPRIRDAFAKELADWRDGSLNPLGPMLPILVFGVLPPMCEELAFRGYLQSALLRRLRPHWAILVSALLFGLFHIVLANMLVPERFFSSALMGLVLGWLCYRTGSLFPGMLLHAIHNSFIVLVAYYEKQLPVLEGHLPWYWLLAAGGVAGLGLLLAWLQRPPSGDRVAG
jgi:ABC-2 type transport system permease protein/sodium transport system permease protein